MFLALRSPPYPSPPQVLQLSVQLKAVMKLHEEFAVIVCEHVASDRSIRAHFRKRFCNALEM